MSRRVWMITALIVIIFVGLLAGISYAAMVATKSANNKNTSSSVNGVQVTSTTTGTQVCGASVSANELRTFEIVPEQTTASYKVRENLIIRNLPSNDAIGKTHNVQGLFRIRTQRTPLVADIDMTIDMRDLQSDSPVRDNYVRKNYLQTDKYPNATFKSSCAQNLPETYKDGAQVTFQMPGELTLHGSTKQTTFEVRGKVVGKAITGAASTTVLMSQFGIQPPNLANFVVSEDKTVITIEFTARER